jgi:hypothetical protein
MCRARDKFNAPRQRSPPRRRVRLPRSHTFDNNNLDGDRCVIGDVVVSNKRAAGRNSKFRGRGRCMGKRKLSEGSGIEAKEVRVSGEEVALHRP